MLDGQVTECFSREPFILELKNKQGVPGPEGEKSLLSRRQGRCKGPEAERHLRGC